MTSLLESLLSIMSVQCSAKGAGVFSNKRIKYVKKTLCWAHALNYSLLSLSCKLWSGSCYTKKHFACQLVRFERSFWFGTKSLNLVLRSSCNLFHFILHAIKSTMFSFCRLVKGILSICIVIFEDFFLL